MATKTISVDLEAYERLRRAKLTDKESFSQVIKRAVWMPAEGTAGRLLVLTRSAESHAAKADIDRLDRAQDEDTAAPNRWVSKQEEAIKLTKTDSRRSRRRSPVRG